MPIRLRVFTSGRRRPGSPGLPSWQRPENPSPTALTGARGRRPHAACPARGRLTRWGMGSGTLASACSPPCPVPPHGSTFPTAKIVSSSASGRQGQDADRTAPRRPSDAAPDPVPRRCGALIPGGGGACPVPASAAGRAGELTGRAPGSAVTASPAPTWSDPTSTPGGAKLRRRDAAACGSTGRLSTDAGGDMPSFGTGEACAARLWRSPACSVAERAATAAVWSGRRGQAALCESRRMIPQQPGFRYTSRSPLQSAVLGRDSHGGYPATTSGPLT